MDIGSKIIDVLNEIKGFDKFSIIDCDSFSVMYNNKQYVLKIIKALEIGDTIKSKNNDKSRGLVGKVICIDTDGTVGVEFPDFDGHDLVGRLPNENGWWLCQEDIDILN